MSKDEQLESSIIEEINREHQCVIDAAKKTADQILETVNAALRCGWLLQKAKQDCRDTKGHGHWLIWIKENLDCSAETARRYIGLAKAYSTPVCNLPDGVHSLKDLMISSGMLSSPSGHGDQKRHLPESLYGWLTLSSPKFFERINKEIKSRPIQSWSQDERNSVKRQLQPIIEVYEQL